jgi:hypothetical protein
LKVFMSRFPFGPEKLYTEGSRRLCIPPAKALQNSYLISVKSCLSALGNRLSQRLTRPNAFKFVIILIKCNLLSELRVAELQQTLHNYGKPFLFPVLSTTVVSSLALPHTQ